MLYHQKKSGRLGRSASLVATCLLGGAPLLAQSKMPNPAADVKTPPMTQQTQQTQQSDVKNFLLEVQSINTAEIAAGDLAEKKAQANNVKKFGRMMVEDHQKASKKVAELAAKKDLSLDLKNPAVPDNIRKMEEKHDALLKELRDAKGAAFDHTYTQAMVDGHREAADMLRQAQRQLSDAEARSLAGDLLVTVESHLKQAEALRTLSH